MVIPPAPSLRPVAGWDEIGSLFGLGPVVGYPIGVVGGWSHHLWRLETDAGSFAVKELVPATSSWWAERLEEAIQLEQAAWAAGTVPMAEPIPVAGSGWLVGAVLLRGHEHRYRCHRWVEGTPCMELSPSEAASASVGAGVAAIAALGLDGGTSTSCAASDALNAYEATVAEAKRQGAGWADELDRLKPLVEELRADLADLAGRAEPLLIMHRDVDPKNASMRADGAVALFDWDYSGPVLPGAELLGAALSFARRGGGAEPLHRAGRPQVNEAYLAATLDAYERVAGHLPDMTGAAAPRVEEGFRWLMLNARRALGWEPATPDQAKRAEPVVTSMCSDWPRGAAAVRAWASRIA